MLWLRDASGAEAPAEGRAGAGSGEGDKAGHGIEDPAPGGDEGGELPNPPVNP